MDPSFFEMMLALWKLFALVLVGFGVPWTLYWVVAARFVDGDWSFAQSFWKK